ncbi:MAG: protein phosphatase 2C domain-containing protein [Candidatus Melainabacteria bacterium HGW-Melainabacteria-1]|nr:MAG: protein phosphatase 2C domain-containing protein [Candidatus Melainabacteria bacterium HGW-Melainabacteria-1]
MPNSAARSGGVFELADWQFLGATVPGSSHLRQDLPNQDSWLGKKSEQGLVLAVSDGHGSAQCFRSEIGSRFAVEVFADLLSDFLAGSYGEDLSDAGEDLTLIKRLAEERLPRQLSREWEIRVLNYHQAHPVADTEWQRLAELRGEAAVERLHQHPLLIYGATLVGAVITPRYIMYLQLGDGEILDADQSGQMTDVMPPDERLIANETTSLCRPEAWRDFRFRFQVLSSATPILILLTTDGYFNSFRERSGFYQVGSDLLQMLRSEGPEWIQTQLPDWLSEATAAGSGDDATLALAWYQPGLAHLPIIDTAEPEEVPVEPESEVEPLAEVEPIAEVLNANETDDPSLDDRVEDETILKLN